MAAKTPKFDKPAPDIEAKMVAIEKQAEGVAPTPEKKALPAELVSGDKNAHMAFTVRIEKDLKERLSFLVLVAKRSGDKNITVASTVERILREKVNAELEALGYDTGVSTG